MGLKGRSISSSSVVAAGAGATALSPESTGLRFNTAAAPSMGMGAATAGASFSVVAAGEPSGAPGSG